MSSTLTDQSQDRRQSLWWLVVLVGSVALAIDLVTKLWALDNLVEGEPKPLVGEFLKLDLVFNPGAAFSLGESWTWVFAVLSSAVVVVLLWYSTKVHSKFLAVILGLLLGGAAGNLFDRLTQPPGFARGHVIDFINYNNWFVGNVADIWIVVGALAMIFWLLNKTEADPAKEEPAAPHLIPAQEVVDASKAVGAADE